MTLKVIRGGFAELGERWGELCRTTDAMPFSTPEFGQTWWSVFGGSSEAEVELLGLENGTGELIGLAPLKRCGAHWSFAGDHEISDYLGPAAKPGQEAVLADAVLERLEGAGAAQAEFRGLEPGSRWVEAFAVASKRGWQLDVSDEAVCPTVSIEGGWDAYLSGLRPRDRREVRRKLRPLRQLGGAVAFESAETPGAVAARMPEFMAMMADSRGDKAVFLTEQMRTFFERLTGALAEAGVVRLYVMSISGEAAAMVLCFVARNQLLLYNSGYAPKFRDLSAGLGSKVLCIRDAVEQGMSSVNFLRGDEPYKYELGGRDAVVRRIRLTREVA
ncbi:MAG: GNAT family N-acetyltransferase [Chloroflexi bacterium]|nr:GNAT family N-acetyltransferase [Chloroflexota bacterium]MYD15939.1 GNAT family N-acetyltransferase [Chloroflexota bacterium]MYF80881.1 GNAT family N-acetyltransferase [Chloroflexota bacterium]MYI04355.1 GNAT family N-acetyltransferase [Chloroflexota bacterium]